MAVGWADFTPGTQEYVTFNGEQIELKPSACVLQDGK
jgi:hypothetical protein